MATRFWVGGSGTWDGSATTHWSALSGGAGGASAPTSSDDAVFDALSSATGYSLTIAPGATCQNVSFTNPASGTLSLSNSNAGPLTVSGNFTVVSAIAVAYVGAIIFTATSGTKTITTNGVILKSSLTFNGAGGTFQLVDNLNTTGIVFTMTAGTFDPNGKTVTMSGITAKIIPTVPVTFFDLSIVPVVAAKTNELQLSGDITISNQLTISNGATVTNRVLVNSSTVGVPVTLTAATVSIASADFRDIIAAGAANWNLAAITGLSGDCGGNTGFTFTTAADQHFTNTSGGNWSTSANWTSRVPLPQDNVFFNLAFTTSRTVTLDMPRAGKTIDWTGATWTTSLTFSGGSSSFFGSLILISSLSFNLFNQTWTFEGRSSYTLTSFNLAIARSVTLNAPGGTLTLVGDLNLSSSPARTLTIANGTLACATYVITTDFVAVTGGTFNLGSATHLITGQSAAAVWNVTGGTIIAGTSTIKLTFSAGGGSAVLFTGGDQTYNIVWFDRGSNAVGNAIGGSNTFIELKDTGTATHSLNFAGGTTQTITTWSVSGIAGHLITISTSPGATLHNLVKAGGGIVSADYLVIAHSAATPASTWYAGANSTNNQAVPTAGSGWIFTVPPPQNTGNMFLVF